MIIIFRCDYTALRIILISDPKGWQIGDHMISLDACQYLLVSGFASEFYMPIHYLDLLDEEIHTYRWTILPSSQAGWVLLRRRGVLFD